MNKYSDIRYVVFKESFNVLDCGIYRVISRRGSQSDEETGSLLNHSVSEEERLKEFGFVQDEDQVDHGRFLPSVISRCHKHWCLISVLNDTYYYLNVCSRDPSIAACNIFKFKKKKHFSIAYLSILFDLENLKKMSRLNLWNLGEQILKQWSQQTRNMQTLNSLTSFCSFIIYSFTLVPSLCDLSIYVCRSKFIFCIFWL